MSMMIALPHVLVKSIVPTEAETTLADRLAFLADGGDPDDYRSEWVDHSLPTFEDEMYDSGYSIGLTGALVGVAVAFPHFSESSLRAGGKSFTLGRNAGLRVHAEQVGHDLGLDGKPCVRPLLISGLFDREFVAGWQAGATEKADREQEMSDYFQRLDDEHAWEMEQREIDAINREVGGWDRAGNLALI